jgi:hypothetical protein
MIRNLQFETAGRIEMIGDVSFKNTWALIKEFGVKRLLIDVY